MDLKHSEDDIMVNQIARLLTKTSFLAEGKFWKER